jgi:hypothetical protein
MRRDSSRVKHSVRNSTVMSASLPVSDKRLKSVSNQLANSNLELAASSIVNQLANSSKTARFSS